MISIHKIADILRQHVGRENTITSTAIAHVLGLRPSTERKIREAISAESWEEHNLIVVGIPGHGYYVPRNLEECHTYLALLIFLRDALNTRIEKFLRNCKAQGIHLQQP